MAPDRSKRETRLPKNLRGGEYVMENAGKNSSGTSENQHDVAFEELPTSPGATADLAQGEETPAIINDGDNTNIINETSNSTTSEGTSLVNEANSSEREDNLIEFERDVLSTPADALAEANSVARNEGLENPEINPREVETLDNSTLTLNDMNIQILYLYEELKSEIKRNQESRAAVQILYNVSK